MKLGRLGSLLDAYLDRWLQIQLVQRPEKRVDAGRGGMVMVYGPCAEMKATAVAGEERRAA